MEGVDKVTRPVFYPFSSPIVQFTLLSPFCERISQLKEKKNWMDFIIGGTRDDSKRERSTKRLQYAHNWWIGACVSSNLSRSLSLIARYERQKFRSSRY